MKKHRPLKSHLCEALYTVANHLPSSLSRFGKQYKKIRERLAKGFIAYCGDNVNIEPHTTFNLALQIGDNSGKRTVCDIRIGNNVMMGTNCIIYTRNHVFARIDIPMCQQGFSEVKPVIIKDDVWIGGRVTILPGVTIGEGCVLAAGTVVTKSTPPYSVVGGNPAKVIKYRK